MCAVPLLPGTSVTGSLSHSITVNGTCSIFIGVSPQRKSRKLAAAHTLLDALTVFHLTRRNSRINRPRLQVFGRHRSKAKNRPIPKIHSRRNTGTRRNPGIAPEPHGKRNHGKFWDVVVMGSAAQIRPLRHNRSE